MLYCTMEYDDIYLCKQAYSYIELWLYLCIQLYINYTAN